MSSYSEGQIHQLAEALQAKGYTPDYITKLGQYDRLGDIRLVLDGLAEIVTTKYVIDFDAEPFIPEGWEVRAEDQLVDRVRGQFVWDPTKVGLYLADQQKSGTIVGHELRKALKDQPVYGAQLLDFWLKNPNLIPEGLKGKYTFFWGTKYRYSDGGLCVRCLYWSVGQWDWDYSWLDSIWLSGGPAAVSASI